MVLEAFLIAAIALLAIFLLKQNRRPKKYPPGPQTLPLIGNIHQLGLEPHKTFMKMRKVYGDVFAITFGSYKGVIINDYRLIKEAMNLPEFQGRPKLRPFTERSGGINKGVIFTEGKEWAEQRRFILKNLKDFGYGKQSMESLIRDETQELLEGFLEENGKPICTQNRFGAAVLNALWRITTGERYSQTDEKLNELIQAVTTDFVLLKAVGPIFFLPWLSKLLPEVTGYNQYMRMINKTLKFIKDTIEQHKKTYQEQNTRDLIDAYWKEIIATQDKRSSFHGVTGETNLLISVFDLFIGGSETTSTTLTWSCLLLAHNPKVQQKLYEEISAVVGTRSPCLDDRKSMPYTEAVICEVLRFSSLAPLSAFHSALEDVEFNGFIIPKDTLVIINLYSALHDPEVWGDPDNFRPERFLSEDGKTVIKHPALIPFSTGKRVCLGESLARDELFLFLTSLCQRFDVGFDPNQPIPKIAHHLGAQILVPLPHELVFHDRFM